MYHSYLFELSPRQDRLGFSEAGDLVLACGLTLLERRQDKIAGRMQVLDLLLDVGVLLVFHVQGGLRGLLLLLSVRLRGLSVVQDGSGLNLWRQVVFVGFFQAGGG